MVGINHPAIDNRLNAELNMELIDHNALNNEPATERVQGKQAAQF